MEFDMLLIEKDLKTLLDMVESLHSVLETFRNANSQFFLTDSSSGTFKKLWKVEKTFIDLEYTIKEIIGDSDDNS